MLCCNGGVYGGFEEGCVGDDGVICYAVMVGFMVDLKKVV